MVYNVSPSTEAIPGQSPSYGESVSWSNGRGQVVKTRGPRGEFRKMQYDGAGRMKGSFVSYDDAESGYVAAQDVVGDLSLIHI